MTKIFQHKGKWRVYHERDEWEFNTHKEAQEKIDQLMSIKLEANKERYQ